MITNILHIIGGCALFIGIVWSFWHIIMDDLLLSKEDIERYAPLVERLKTHYDYNEITGDYVPNKRCMDEAWEELVENFRKREKHLKEKWIDENVFEDYHDDMDITDDDLYGH